MHEEIELSRDCEAIQIPSGVAVTLPAGTRVVVTQSLGGSYTVAGPTGLYRITDFNADALGKELPARPAPSAADGPAEATEADVWEQLKTCYDPEIPVNIVDLGLIYDCTLLKKDDGRADVSVKMTLTAPGCGMGPTIAAEAKMRIESIPGVDAATVELVWDPPWDQSMISEAGKMQLGLI